MNLMRTIPVQIFGLVRVVIFITAFYLLLPGNQPAWAADEPEDVINYAYSSWIASPI